MQVIWMKGATILSTTKWWDSNWQIMRSVVSWRVSSWVCMKHMVWRFHFPYPHLETLVTPLDPEYQLLSSAGWVHFETHKSLTSTETALPYVMYRELLLARCFSFEAGASVATLVIIRILINSFFYRVMTRRKFTNIPYPRRNTFRF